MIKSITILLLLSSSIVNAQLKKGNKMLGASFAGLFYNSSETILTVPAPTTGHNTKENSFGFTHTPSVGWFITDQVVVGATLDLGIDKKKITNEAGGNTYAKNESTATRFGAGGFLRYYMKKSGNDIPFIHLSLGAGSGTLKNEGFFYNGNAYKDTYSGKGSGIFNFNSTLAVGLSKLLSPTTAFDLSLGYRFAKMNNTLTSITYRDVGIDGDTDETYNSKPKQKTTLNGVFVSMGLQVFMEKNK